MALMRSTTNRLDLDKALAPIALHRPPCCALGQRRGDGVIGRISKGDANHLRALDPGRAVISWRDTVSVRRGPFIANSECHGDPLHVGRHKMQVARC